MTMRDEFWGLVLSSQKNRDSVGRMSGWCSQLNELNKTYEALKERHNKVRAELSTANNKIIELEAAIAKLVKPKRKYNRRKNKSENKPESKKD